MNLLIIGSTGQMGKALAEAARLKNHNILSLGRDKLDLSKPDQIRSRLDSLSSLLQEAHFGPFLPAAVINAAAYTAVDQAEIETTQALKINSESVGEIAAWCNAHRSPLVHYSTDYVFPGTGQTPWTEEDSPDPVNAYGMTKLAGEKAIQLAHPLHLIFRISWVYDATGKNFLNTMLKLGRERKKLSVVCDQIGAPSFAGHLATLTLQALEEALVSSSFPTGIYHLAPQGVCSWFQFAETIFECVRAQEGSELILEELTPIKTNDYPTRANRPLNSRLNCKKFQDQFKIPLPQWREGLTTCLRN